MGRNGAEWVSQTVKHSRHKRILKRVSGIGRRKGEEGEDEEEKEEKGIEIVIAPLFLFK